MGDSLEDSSGSRKSKLPPIRNSTRPKRIQQSKSPCRSPLLDGSPSSRASPSSQLTTPSPVQHRSFQDQSSRSISPESEIQGSLAFKKDEQETVKRKRRHKKRKEYSRSNLNLMTKSQNNVAINDKENASENMTKNITKLPGSSAENSVEKISDTDSTSNCISMSLRKPEQLVSIEVQTDLSWVHSDEATILKTSGDDKDELDDPTCECEIKSDDEPVTQVQVLPDETQRVVKSASKKRLIKKRKLRKVKSAEAIRTSISKGALDSNSKLPEILQYHGESAVLNTESVIKVEPNPIHVTQSVFHGLCQFCGKVILPIPSVEEMDNADKLKELFCCADFGYFLQLNEASLVEEKKYTGDHRIDITSRGQGSKTNKKNLKDRMAERVRERELEKQRTAQQQAVLFANFSRQMKTIQFSLMSPKCLSDGWAMDPQATAQEETSVDKNIFQIEINSTLLQKSDVFNEKFYDNGKPFLKIFPDGTGCCYYPNGNVAVMIVSTEPGKYSYIVLTNQKYDENSEDSGILAIFEANGNSMCFFQRTKKLRLFMNAHGGLELDRKGRKRKRWQWYFHKGHASTPPFQPLFFPLNKYLSVRLLDQDNIALIFTSTKKSVRFNVGANITALKIKGLGLFEADKSEKYLQTKKHEINEVLVNIHQTLRLPKSNRLNKVFPNQLPKTPSASLRPSSNAEEFVFVN